MKQSNFMAITQALAFNLITKKKKHLIDMNKKK